MQQKHFHIINLTLTTKMIKKKKKILPFIEQILRVRPFCPLVKPWCVENICIEVQVYWTLKSTPFYASLRNKQTNKTKKNKAWDDKFARDSSAVPVKALMYPIFLSLFSYTAPQNPKQTTQQKLKTNQKNLPNASHIPASLWKEKLLLF